MARKTLKEKQLSDTRHLYHFEKVVSPQLRNLQSDTHALLVSDLGRTILTTSLILLSQAILFLILKNHLIRIPGISY